MLQRLFKAARLSPALTQFFMLHTPIREFTGQVNVLIDVVGVVDFVDARCLAVWQGIFFKPGLELIWLRVGRNTRDEYVEV
jgi:hypothetical protein